MESRPTWVPVVALALFDERGRVLLQRRLPAKHHAGLWEFPGGKVETNENPRAALRREIAEELNIMVDTDDLEPALMADEGTCGPIVLMLYTAARWTGTIDGRDGQEWGWFERAAASQLPMPPMDDHLRQHLWARPIAKRR